MWRTCWRIRAESGQATVEAATLLPVLMLLFALLVQPVCAFYTLCVMRHAAAETARVMVTTDEEDVAVDYALRRLAAVPESCVFHVGGPRDWNVAVGRETDGTVTVRVTGHVRPLPFFGVVVDAMGPRDAQGVLLCTELAERVRPRWLVGSYGEWVRVWEG